MLSGGTNILDGFVQKLKKRTSVPLTKYRLQDGLLRLETGELCIHRKLVPEMLRKVHDSPSRGQFGIDKTATWGTFIGHEKYEW